MEEKKNEAIKAGRVPWRVSSTLFSHLRGDVMLEPLPKFQTAESKAKYPPISGADHATQELEAISLKKT